MTAAAHPYIVTTLAKLLDLIRVLDDEIPDHLTPEERSAWKFAQIGALLAGANATCHRSGIGARGRVRAEQWQCSQNPAVQVLLDRFRSVGPISTPYAADLKLATVRQGAAIAESVIAGLPSAPVDDDSTDEEKREYATWIGAITGVFEGLLLDLGFEPIAFDAAEVARQALLSYADEDLLPDPPLPTPSTEDN